MKGKYKASLLEFNLRDVFKQKNQMSVIKDFFIRGNNNVTPSKT